jgi:RHS repeat-associated protein
METIKPILIIGALMALFCNAASAQTGDDNPYGSGPFNGEVTTGCDYDPYSANARRVVTDISLPSVSYPLEFTRTSVSRGASQDFPPGQFSTAVNGGDLYAPTTWVHSYQWRVISYECYSVNGGSTCDGSGHPRDLTVLYPDGSQVTFGPSNNPPGDPYWRGGSGTGKGARERLHIFYDTTSPVTGRVYLLLPDGGKVEWTFLKVGSDGTGYTTYNYTLSQIIDPFGRVTTVAVQPDQSVIVTEPAGRWLRMYYKHPAAAEGNSSDWVVYQVTASDGRAVYYNYTANIAGTHQYVYTTLTSVNYSWDSNLTSTYTYQTNNDNANQTPLLSTAIDPLYTGPMWRIAYKYITPSNTSGQIQSENYFDGTTIGAAVTSLSAPFPRIETRADGKTRTFTYNTFAELTNYTDFLGNSAALGYGISGYTNGGLGIPTKIWDFKNNETDITLNQFTTLATQTTFPATPEDAPAGRGTVSRSYVSDSCSTDPTHCDSNNMDSNNPYYLFSSTDEAGHATYYKRDSNHRVTSISYPDGGSESFTYTQQLGQVQTHTLKTGDTITFQYDGRGLMQLCYDQEHSATAPNFWFGFDSFDRLNAVTDALGSGLGDPNHTTNYTYNSRSQVLVTTLPVDPVDGQRHTITNNYNPVDGTLASVVDQLNHQTSYTWDNYRRIRTITTPGHNTLETTSVFYGPTDSGDDYTYTDKNPTFIKSPSGKETAIVYDENRRKKSVTQANGTSDAATTSYTYDANGNLTSTVSPNEQPGQLFAGQSSSTSYDERNRAYSSTDALQHPTSKTFDVGGRVASITRANGQVTTFDNYDPMNRVLQKTVNQSPDPAAVSKYTYYTSGLLHTFQDPHLVAIGSTDSYSYIYDSLGRQTSLTYPKASPSATPTVESWHYDYAGRNDTFTNRNGFVLTNSYDNLDRRYYSSWNDGLTPSVTIGYDVANRPVSVTNANAAITWSYFNDNLLNTETSTYADNVARTVTHTYDDDNNDATISYPNNAYTFTYHYTNLNQLWTVVNGSSTLITFGYDPNGNLLTRVPNNGTSSSFIYDGLNRVTKVSHTFNGTTRSFAYGYDFVGNQKWVKRDGGNGDVFGFDLNDQSTSVLLNVANPDTASPGNQTVFYDAGGNRTAFQAQGLNDSYATNPLNQYTSRNSSSATYDPTGNMTAGVDGSIYTFDAQNRLLNATKPPSQTPITFGYDGLNRPVKRVNNRAVQAVSAVSRMTHGSAGTFDVPLPLVGSPGIECRSTGGNFQIVVTFPTGVSYSGATVTMGTASISSISSSSDNTQITINLTGVANAQTVVVTLSGVTDGQAMNDVPVAMSVLAGDTTGNGLVNSGDVSQTQGQAGQPVTSSNFREDVTVSGVINSSDISVVQSASGTYVGSYSQNAPTPGTVYFVYDGWDLIGEYAPGATTPSIAYLYGAGGLVKNLSNNEYYYQDGRGSTSHVANSTGALNEYYQYDLHGAPMFYNGGGTQITASAYGVRHLFNGEQWRSDLGLYDLRHRFYSPDLGRFIQADPSGHAGGDNLYRYCSNNPLKNSDPTGLYDYGENPYFDLFPGDTWIVPDTYGNGSGVVSEDGSVTLNFTWTSQGGQTPSSNASPANQVPQQFPGNVIAPQSGIHLLSEELGTFAPTWINNGSSSPLASNFSTGLPVFASPISGATVELSHRAQIKADLVNSFHSFVDDLRADPTSIVPLVMMNSELGPVRGVTSWAEFMKESGGIRYGLMSKDGKIIEHFSPESERMELGLGGHRGARTDDLIKQMRDEGVVGFTVGRDGSVVASESFAPWEPHVTLANLQEWADGFIGAPKLHP